MIPTTEHTEDTEHAMVAAPHEYDPAVTARRRRRLIRKRLFDTIPGLAALAVLTVVDDTGGIATIVCGCLVVALVFFSGAAAALNWRLRIRPCQGTSAAVENGTLVIRGPGEAFRILPLAGAQPVFLRDKAGLAEIRLFGLFENSPVILLGYADMDGLANEIATALVLPPEGPIHRYREDLAGPAIRRIRRRMCSAAVLIPVFALVVITFDSVAERIACSAVLLAIPVISLALVWRQTVGRVRGTTAAVVGQTLRIRRSDDPATVYLLPFLRIRERRTRGVLDSIWLCRGDSVVVRLFGYEDLDGLRDEILGAISPVNAAEPAAPATHAESGGGAKEPAP